MEFEFVDTEAVIKKTRALKRQLEGNVYEDYRYRAYVDTTEETPLSALSETTCWVTAHSNGEEIMLMPILPMPFDIKLRGVGTLLDTFQRLYHTWSCPTDVRTRVTAEQYARDPVDALRALRSDGLWAYLEAETADTDAYTELVRGSPTRIDIRTQEMNELGVEGPGALRSG